MSVSSTGGGNNNDNNTLPEYMMQPQSRLKVVAGYALQQKLGSGSFAVVYKGVKLQPTGNYDDYSAIKAIARTSEKLTKKVLQNLEVEISILRTYRHRNIVCMHDVQKTANHFYLILEYCAGGDVQGLIRSRKDRRLSEGLTRRLMRDLAHGLSFLWKQQLIHRDIKPQNLLLTGPLPLDEMNDPEATVEGHEYRQRTNFASADFCLKIADFGFARHLQSTSLAETLCGSPLYMAPEILQHHRYDAKADLWSVGTVLFEMISGEPPFHGENHIDLLRNIQRKAVRLPKDVRVSKECVNLLRLLLSRNPLTRAGFKEFFEACDAFVALGCLGVSTVDEGTCKRPSMDLGTIPEYPTTPTPPASESLMTVSTNAPSQPLQHPSTVVPPPSMDPTNLKVSYPVSIVPSSQTLVKQHQPTTGHHYTNNTFSPLVPSPPNSNGVATGTTATDFATMGGGGGDSKRMPQAIEMPTRRNDGHTEGISSGGGLHNSADEGSFVMVEHGTSLSQHHGTVGASAAGSNNVESIPTSTAVVSHYGEPYRQQPQHLEQSPPSSPNFFFNRFPVLSSRGDYMVVKGPKGMLSTSPGTGGALMTMLTGRPQLTATPAECSISSRPVYINEADKIESQLKDAAKMLAAAEDVGRRAISVAHLGDRRAYYAMRMLTINDSSASSVASVTPMEGIVEESGDHDSGEVTDDSSSTEIMASVRRRRSSTSMADKSMADVKREEDTEEMPFAMPSESTPLISVGLSPHPNNAASIAYGNKDSTMSVARDSEKPTAILIQSHFREALTCYLKALKMLKGAISATEGVSRELNELTSTRILAQPQQKYTDQMKQRCEVTLSWLGSQFKGVLERGNAANTEISKLPAPEGLSESPMVTSTVEELLFNHSMGYGREGAVKQLLGHYEAARSCYRSAGLLAETLLMEQKMDSEDRKTLEGFVDGFAAQITEIDDILIRQSQSRLTTTATSTTSNHPTGSSSGLVHTSQQRSPRIVSSLVGNPFSMFPGNKY